MLKDAAIRQLVKDVELKTCVIFDRMMRHRSAGTVAQRLNYDVTTVSKHLTKLRDKTGDALFVTEKGQKIPTERAVELHVTVQKVIDLLATEFDGVATFEYSSDQTHFTILVEDYFSTLVAPQLVDTLTAVAGDISLSIDVIPNISDNEKSKKMVKAYQEMMLAGDIDLLVSAHQQAFDQSDIKTQHLLSDSMIAVFDEAVYDLVSEDDELIENLVQLKGSAVLKALPQKPEAGHSDISGFATVMNTLKGAAFYAELPKRFVQEQQCEKLRCFELSNTEYTLYQYWHAQNHKNPAHRWLRRTLKTACQQVALV